MPPKKKSDKNIPKNMSETTFDALLAMGTEELKAVVVSSTFEAAEMKRKRDLDQTYVDAKETFAAIRDGYGDVIKAEKAKADLALETLQDRGVSLSREDLQKVAKTNAAA